MRRWKYFKEVSCSIECGSASKTRMTRNADYCKPHNRRHIARENEVTCWFRFMPMLPHPQPRGGLVFVLNNWLDVRIQKSPVGLRMKRNKIELLGQRGAALPAILMIRNVNQKTLLTCSLAILKKEVAINRQQRFCSKWVKSLLHNSKLINTSLHCAHHRSQSVLVKRALFQTQLKRSYFSNVRTKISL